MLMKAKHQGIWNWLKNVDEVDSTKSDDRPAESDESPILKLRANFEQREAICVEKGALRVRVSDIHGSAAQREVLFKIEEIPSPGLGVGQFDRSIRKEKRPLRFTIGGGYLTEFSEHCWAMGYGGWSLHFDPKLVQAVLDLASRLPEDMDTFRRYSEITDLVFDPTFVPKNWQRVFPNT